MLEVHDHGSIRTIRLARPPVNALHAPLLESLAAAVARAPAEGARGLVLTGSGGRYSAGLDVQALAALDPAGLEAFLVTFFDCLTVLATCPLPIVAAINGASPAGGAVLALYCDRRVMARGDFRIGLNEVQVGLYPGPLIHRVLARIVGARLGAELLITGALLTPAEALASGFVDELAEPAELEPRARAWLERVLALPAHAFLATRALVRRDLVELMTAGSAADRAALAAAWGGPETRAALAALLARLGRK